MAPTGDIFDQPPGRMSSIRGKHADHLGDHVVLSPEGTVLATSTETKSLYPRPPQSLNNSSDHGLISSYEGHKERRTGKICGAFSRIHRALDGWMLASAPASPDQGLHHDGPRYFNFLLFVQCMVLRNLDLLINLSGLLLRTLVVGRRQQYESIEIALDMEKGGLMNRFGIGRCHCL